MSKIKSFALILGVFIMSFLIGYLVLAWTEPTAVPPGGNVAAPLNVSSTGQTKNGYLAFTAFYDVNLKYFVSPSASWSAGLSGPITVGFDPTVAQTPSAPGAMLDIKPSSVYPAGLMIRPYGAAAGNTGEIRLMELTANGTNYIGFKAPDSLPGNRIYTLPDFPSTDSFLKSSSTGVLSWASSAISWPLQAPSSLDGSISYSFASDTDTGISWSLTNKLSFFVDNNMVMRMSPSRVGIGTVDPGAKLDVYNSTTGTDSLVSQIWNDRDASNYNGLLINIARTAPNTDAYALNVRTGGTSRLYVRSDGNVGIGTTSPGQELDVGATATPAIRISNTNSTIGAETNIGALEFWGKGTQNVVVSKISADSQTSWQIAPTSSLSFFTYYSGSLQERMRITPDGNIGIGTTSPGYKLDVNGDINTSGVYRKGGTAGIGLSCGASQVIKGATVSGGIVTAGTCAADETGGLPAGSAGDTLRYDGTNWVANNVIYNNGTNVGIGVGSSIDPSYKLTIASTGVKITNTGSTYTLYAEDEASDATPFVIDASGNVGIGTTSPGQKLDVDGNINYTGYIYHSGTRGLPGDDIRPGARITLTGHGLAGCSGNVGVRLRVYSIVVPTSKTLRVWAMGAAQEYNGTPLNAAGLVNINTGDIQETENFYIEGSPLYTYSGGTGIAFTIKCLQDKALYPAGYWVISIE